MQARAGSWGIRNRQIVGQKELAKRNLGPVHVPGFPGVGKWLERGEGGAREGGRGKANIWVNTVKILAGSWILLGRSMLG